MEGIVLGRIVYKGGETNVVAVKGSLCSTIMFRYRTNTFSGWRRLYQKSKIRLMYGCLIKSRTRNGSYGCQHCSFKIAYGNLIQTHSPPPPPEIILTNLRCQSVILSLFMAIILLLMAEVWSDFLTVTPMMMRLLLCDTFCHGESWTLGPIWFAV